MCEKCCLFARLYPAQGGDLKEFMNNIRVLLYENGNRIPYEFARRKSIKIDKSKTLCRSSQCGWDLRINV